MVAIAQHSLRAFVTGGTYGDFRIIDAEIIRDQFSFPYIKAVLTIARPTAELMGVLDPRNSLRVSLIAEKLYSVVRGNDQPVPADQYKSMRLWLLDRDVNYADGTVTLRLGGSEVLAEDYCLMASAPVTFTAGLLLSTVTNRVLSRIGRSLVSGTSDTARLTEDAEWTPGQSAWNFLTPLLEAKGRRLWADETDNFRLTPRIDEPGGAARLTLGESPITQAMETLARTGDYYDAVHVTYKWDNADGIEQVRYDMAQASPRPRRVMAVEYTDTFYPGAGAASQLLKRSLAKGRRIDLSFAQDYTVNPGDSATILLEPDELSAGYITATRWTFPGFEMSIDTRDLTLVPEYAWVNAPEGVSWNDAPAGMDWNEAITLYETEAN